MDFIYVGTPANSTIICMYGHHITYSKSMDQPGKVANPVRGQLNREKNISLFAFAPENLVSRDGFGSLVPRQLAHSPYYSQAESGACLRDFSRVPRRRPFIYFKPPYAIGSVPSLKKNLNASRPSEHSPVRGGKSVKTFRWDDRLQINTKPLHGI